MLHKLRPVHAVLVTILLLSLVYLQGVASVPFHPDESSYLYMSSDLSQVFADPLSIALRQRPTDERSYLRLLDPPLIHFAAEIGRRLGGQPPLPVNWRWDLPWMDNEMRGAVPSPALLLWGRLAVAGLFPLSLLFLYFATRLLSNEFTAFLAVLFMATNSFLLLHTRRVMAEGIMIFALTLSLWVLLKAEKRTWLAAIPIGIAFCAKQSLATLGLTGFFAAAWSPLRPISTERRTAHMVLYSLLALVVILALTPIAWKYPFQTTEAVFRARREILAGQVAKYSDRAMDFSFERVTHLVDQTFFAPLMFYEDPRYADYTRASEAAYMNSPWNMLTRSTLAGSVLLVLSLVGIIAGFTQVRSPDLVKKRRFTLILLATLLQITGLLIAIPLIWQRYYLPLIPFACIWSAYGANQIKELLLRTWGKRWHASAVPLER